jgi:hypothetical protein
VPTSTTGPRDPRKTMGRHDPPTQSVPGGQEDACSHPRVGSADETLACEPGGHAASKGTQAKRPLSTRSDPVLHGPGRPRVTATSPMHPVSTSAISVAWHAGKAQRPSGRTLANGPQYASAAAVGRHAPRTSTCPESQAQRPSASSDASRGHAATHPTPRQADGSLHPAPAPPLTPTASAATAAPSIIRAHWTTRRIALDLPHANRPSARDPDN